MCANFGFAALVEGMIGAGHTSAGAVRSLERPMRRRELITLLGGVVAAAPFAARAQPAPPIGHPSTGAREPGAEPVLTGDKAKQFQAEPVRTGKERLGGKSSDEQRADNCNVPLDLRGPKPRPDDCGDGGSTRSKR
jgi:hypothetical protein